MNTGSGQVPEVIWRLADQVHLRSSIERCLIAGNLTSALRIVADEGEAQAAILNQQRVRGRAPYSFQALLSLQEKSGDEEETYFNDLQKLYLALENTLRAPNLIQTNSS